MRSTIFLFVAAQLLISCNQSVELKKIEASSEHGSSGVFQKSEGLSNSTDADVIKDVHQVEVLQHIRGKRYSYLQVKENNQTYWLATMGGDYVEGNTYAYNEGLMKQNYHSTELDKTFDRILLVSQMFVRGHAHNHEHKTERKLPSNTKIEIPETSITVREIVTNPNNYQNKTLNITGRVTKVNANIMDRNWIHIQDGTMDSYDFVATSKASVPVGHVVTLTGILRLNQDFGAGYSYDIILENAEVQP